MRPERCWDGGVRPGRQGAARIPRDVERLGGARLRELGDDGYLRLGAATDQVALVAAQLTVRHLPFAAGVARPVHAELHVRFPRVRVEEGGAEGAYGRRAGSRLSCGEAVERETAAGGDSCRGRQLRGGLGASVRDRGARTEGAAHSEAIRSNQKQSGAIRSNQARETHRESRAASLSGWSPPHSPRPAAPRAGRRRPRRHRPRRRTPRATGARR